MAILVFIEGLEQELDQKLPRKNRKNNCFPVTNSFFYVLGPEIILVRGLVRLDPAVAYHFCLNLFATFSQPRTRIISGPSRYRCVGEHMVSA